MDESKLPVQCHLDRKKLATIEAKLDLIIGNQADFVSIDGPLGKVRDEVKAVGSKVAAAHRRLDGHDNVLHDLSDRQWQIVWKVGGGVAGGGGVLYMLTKIVERFGG